MTEPGLFDQPPQMPPLVEQKEQISADRRRTMRQLEMLQKRRHPLTGGALHPDAPALADRSAPGPRCRNCAHVALQGGVAGRYTKCGLGPITGGPGTDIRLWWPGCSRWEP